MIRRCNQGSCREYCFNPQEDLRIENKKICLFKRRVKGDLDERWSGDLGELRDPEEECVYSLPETELTHLQAIQLYLDYKKTLQPSIFERVQQQIIEESHGCCPSCEAGCGMREVPEIIVPDGPGEPYLNPRHPNFPRDG